MNPNATEVIGSAFKSIRNKLTSPVDPQYANHPAFIEDKKIFMKRAMVATGAVVATAAVVLPLLSRIVPDSDAEK